MIRHIFSIAMICVGGALEIYYFAWRFQNDGMATWLSIIIGLSLTLLLALSVFNRKQKWSWILICTLVAFSVLSTSAGQSFSLGLKLEEAKQIEQSNEYQTNEIKNLMTRRNTIDKELSDITSAVNRTITNLQDRAIWRTALAIAEVRKEILTEERSKITNELKDLYIVDAKSVSIDAIVNIYQFYNKLFGWRPESLQFILHTILSIFIALMAPIGLITYPQKTYEKKQSQKAYKKRDKKSSKKISMVDRWRPWVEHWVHYNWIGVKNGSKEILSHMEFDKFAEAQGHPFSDAKYHKINISANRKKCIDNGIILCYTETEAIEKILEGITEKREKKSMPVGTGQKDLFT